LTSRTLAKSIAQLASDKKAEDIVVLDMRKLVNYCDYFVLCSGTTDRHVHAIAEYIDENLKVCGGTPHVREGLKTADWIVLDCADVVTHVFQKRLREFYHLEHLWQEAKSVRWEKKTL
jgi:ribosome-associated protein